MASHEDDSLYERIGGEETLHALARAFYARVETDPLLRPLYPRTLTCATHALALFLTQFVGGPCVYSHSRHRVSLREAHARFRIGAAERDAWLRNMTGALEDTEIAEPARSALLGVFTEAAAHLVNTPDAAGERVAPAARAADPEEVEQRWAEHRALEDLIAASKAGDAEEALRLVEGPRIAALTRRDPKAPLVFLGLMAGSGSAELVAYARRRLEAEPCLATGGYGGWTLLHDAAADWAVGFAGILVGLGADPNAIDPAGHAPLYAASNRLVERHARDAEAGGEIVRLLVRAGADVRARGGVKACTALHMAARRGNVSVAAALLDAGAAIEARDSVGETPLRRAVNCGHPEIAALLLARGADPHARGSRGLTPLTAARAAPMQALLRGAVRDGP